MLMARITKSIKNKLTAVTYSNNKKCYYQLITIKEGGLRVFMNFKNRNPLYIITI